MDKVKCVLVVKESNTLKPSFFNSVSSGRTRITGLPELSTSASELPDAESAPTPAMSRFSSTAVDAELSLCCFFGSRTERCAADGRGNVLVVVPPTPSEAAAGGTGASRSMLASSFKLEPLAFPETELVPAPEREPSVLYLPVACEPPCGLRIDMRRDCSDLPPLPEPSVSGSGVVATRRSVLMRS